MRHPRRSLVRWLPVCALLAAAAPALAQDWSGAITLVSPYGPEYLGASKSGFGLRPGFFLRYGRVSLSSGGGFAARREDTERRGLGIDLAASENFDLSLGLRMDGGRDESTSAALAGMGDVKRTVRVRLGALWRFHPQWQVGASWTVDAFNRGGGNVADLKIQNDRPLTERISLTSSAALTLGGPRYMQTWFGVTGEQAARSGYAEYDPGMGLRDLSLAFGLKAELGERWVLVGGPGYTRLLGPAARSPIVQRRGNWTASFGAGYRF